MIPVKQPLQALVIQTPRKFSDQICELICAEVNVLELIVETPEGNYTYKRKDVLSK